MKHGESFLHGLACGRGVWGVRGHRRKWRHPGKIVVWTSGRPLSQAKLIKADAPRQEWQSTREWRHSRPQCQSARAESSF